MQAGLCAPTSGDLSHRHAVRTVRVMLDCRHSKSMPMVQCREDAAVRSCHPISVLSLSLSVSLSSSSELLELLVELRIAPVKEFA